VERRGEAEEEKEKSASDWWRFEGARREEYLVEAERGIARGHFR
jgi:hypothetical protein